METRLPITQIKAKAGQKAAHNTGLRFIQATRARENGAAACKPEVHPGSSVNELCSKETWLETNTALTKWARFGCPGQNLTRSPGPLGNVVPYGWKQAWY